MAKVRNDTHDGDHDHFLRLADRLSAAMSQGQKADDAGEDLATHRGYQSAYGSLRDEVERVHQHFGEAAKRRSFLRGAGEDLDDDDDGRPGRI